MRRWVKRIGLSVAVLFVICQLVPIRRDNPAINPSHTVEATEKLTPAVKAVFGRSCLNCHSNQTRWPWYSYVAPVSWMISSDVHDARKAMNLSNWGSYSANKREEKLEEICEQVTNGDMPDRKYALFHRSSRITPQERDAVCQWTEDSRQY